MNQKEKQAGAPRPSRAQVELAQIEASRERVKYIFSTIKHLISAVACTVVVLLVVSAVKEIGVNSQPESIKALAAFVDKIGLGAWLLGGTTILSSAGWVREHQGRKRTIKEKSRFQRKLEKDDKYRSSSGLKEDGETPEE